MRVLVACEYSGRVRDEFLRRGHDALSCDLLGTESFGPTDENGELLRDLPPAPYHHQGDVLPLLDDDWDMVIAFPPCQRLSCIGVRYWPKWQADGTQDAAAAFFMSFVDRLVHVPRVAIENPAGVMSTRYRKPDQYVQPWWFGDPWTKRTGLWLKGLPKLVADHPVESKGSWVGSQRTSHIGPRVLSGEGSHSDGTPNDGGRLRSHKRSATFPGIARAMAEQWGDLQ